MDDLGALAVALRRTLRLARWGVDPQRTTLFVEDLDSEGLRTDSADILNLKNKVRVVRSVRHLNSFQGGELW